MSECVFCFLGFLEVIFGLRSLELWGATKSVVPNISLISLVVFCYFVLFVLGFLEVFFRFSIGHIGFLEVFGFSTRKIGFLKVFPRVCP